MLIVENVTEPEADGLSWIIEQQANEIVELQSKIRVFLARPCICKVGVVRKGKAFSINTLPNDKSSYTGFVSRNSVELD